MRQRITNLEAKRSAWITTTAIAGFRIVFSVFPHMNLGRARDPDIRNTCNHPISRERIWGKNDSKSFTWVTSNHIPSDPGTVRPWPYSE